MRRAAVCTLGLAALLVAGCGSDCQEPGWLNLVVSVSDPCPSIGETTTLTLTATNTGEIPYVLTFTTSQRHDFVVRAVSGREVWRWSHHREFLQVVSREQIGPGETWTFTQTWDLRDNEGEFLPAGDYMLTGELASLGRPQSNTVAVAIGPGP